MKILVISNFYPPYDKGGYEQLCKEVVDHLILDGFDCKVITSDYNNNLILPDESHTISRVLKLNTRFFSKWAFKPFKNYINSKINNNYIENIKNQYGPDIVFVWNMGYFNKTLIHTIEKTFPKVVYYISDSWIINKFNFKITHFISELFEARYVFLKPAYENLIFSCKYIEEAVIKHIPKKNCYLTYNSVNLQKYIDSSQDYNSKKIQLLFIGRLVDEKGILVLLKSFVRILPTLKNARLTIIGNGPLKNKIEKFIKHNKIEQFVELIPHVNKDSLHLAFSNNNIFIFPSIWEEPFSLTLIYAMASGLPIISTFTGGTKEILINNENCLIYEKNNFMQLAEQIISLSNNNLLKARIGKKARDDARLYDISIMIPKIEQILIEIVGKD